MVIMVFSLENVESMFLQNVGVYLQAHGRLNPEQQHCHLHCSDNLESHVVKTN
jgi:hypothetical protein